MPTNDPKWETVNSNNTWHDNKIYVGDPIVPQTISPPQTTISPNVYPVSSPYVPGQGQHDHSLSNFNMEEFQRLHGQLDELHTDDDRIEDLIEMLEVQPTDQRPCASTFEIKGVRYSLFDILHAQMKFMFRMNILLIHRQLGRQDEE